MRTVRNNMIEEPLELDSDANCEQMFMLDDENCIVFIDDSNEINSVQIDNEPTNFQIEASTIDQTDQKQK